MSRDLFLHNAVAAVRGSLLAVALAAPLLASGCATPVDEEEDDGSANALKGTSVDEGQILRVTASSMNFRATPNGRVIGTLKKDDLVTVIAKGPTQGWVNVRTADGTEGWAWAEFLLEDDVKKGAKPKPVEQVVDTAPRDGDTCAATRGEGVVNQYAKALHDTIAWAEGTSAGRTSGDVLAGRSANDGYDLMFTHALFKSCVKHPAKVLCSGGLCSSAAGRYQFISTTWGSIAKSQNYRTFEPEDQERAAAYLVEKVRLAKIPPDRPMTAAEFSNVLSKISWEWASIPPSRYGQGKKSTAQVRAEYCTILGC